MSGNTATVIFLLTCTDGDEGTSCVKFELPQSISSSACNNASPTSSSLYVISHNPPTLHTDDILLAAPRYAPTCFAR